MPQQDVTEASSLHAVLSCCSLGKRQRPCSKDVALVRRSQTLQDPYVLQLDECGAMQGDLRGSATGIQSVICSKNFLGWHAALCNGKPSAWNSPPQFRLQLPDNHRRFTPTCGLDPGI